MKINPKTDIKQIFLSGIESVLPDKLIKSQVRLSDNILSIQNYSFYLPDFENIFVIGAGKATALMAKEIESILGNYISAGHIVVKYQHKCALNIIEITEAGHPLPDENGREAAQRILTIAKQAGSHDLVICLFSGGASALLADCPDEISLSDLITTNDLLIKIGASIQEINTVRKHISKLKGGQLAKAIYPAQTVSLILSDVIGDRLDVIASGPTYPDPTTFSEAYEILKKYELTEKVPLSVVQYLKRGIVGEIPETPKSDDSIFSEVYNIIIGNNKMALETAGHKAKELGYQAHVITDNLQGNIEETANFILSTIEIFKKKEHKTPVCLLFGGEPIVKVTGDGLGGRNQHLALYLATKLENMPGITILCGGTDGTDGPTDAAGAIVDASTIQTAKEKNIFPMDYFKKSDAYHFFKQVGGHLITGSTKTNVMDMIIAIIE